MPYCHVCGSEVNETANFCPRCGSEQGVPATETPRDGASATRSSLAGRPWANALIGGTAGFLFAAFVASVFLPMYVVGILAGAALAGYLHASGETAGGKVGVLAGLIATAPVLLVLMFGAVIGFGGLALGFWGHLGPRTDIAGFTAIAVISMFVFGLTLVANLLFGALGGFVGGALAEGQDGIGDRHDR